LLVAAVAVTGGLASHVAKRHPCDQAKVCESLSATIVEEQ
jgi:hypothetical protein